MSSLKLVMAVSKDGFLALGPDDPMLWTGSDDKRAFRLLTHSGGALGAGRRTFESLPRLKGRTVVCLSTRRGMVMNAQAREALQFPMTDGPLSCDAAYEATMTLGQFARAHPDGWLIGGRTVAMEALAIDMVSVAFMCRAPIELHRSTLFDPRTAQLDLVTPFLRERKGWDQVDRVRFGESQIEVWRHK